MKNLFLALIGMILSFQAFGQTVIGPISNESVIFTCSTQSPAPAGNFTVNVYQSDINPNYHRAEIEGSNDLGGGAVLKIAAAVERSGTQVNKIATISDPSKGYLTVLRVSANEFTLTFNNGTVGLSNAVCK